MKMPCEIVIWKVLPSLRRQLVNIMVNKYKKRQVDVANSFGLTEAAVSQYVKGKRGCLEIPDERLKKQILLSADVLNDFRGKEDIMHEICRLCRLIRSGPCWKDIAKNSDKR